MPDAEEAKGARRAFRSGAHVHEHACQLGADRLDGKRAARLVRRALRRVEHSRRCPSLRLILALACDVASERLKRALERWLVKPRGPIRAVLEEARVDVAVPIVFRHGLVPKL